MPRVAAGFQRQFRLLNSAQFQRVFRNRRSVHGKYFSVHACGNELEFPRVGLAVSRKVSKRAVQRNRIKRQVRESFRHMRLSLEGIDFVVVAKPGSASQDSGELRSELNTLWSRASKKCGNC